MHSNTKSHEADDILGGLISLWSLSNENDTTNYFYMIYNTVKQQPSLCFYVLLLPVIKI